MNRSLIPIAAVVLAACANPINQRTATNYYEAGETALARGDLQHARAMYSRALVNARLGRMGPVAEIQALSKLGQVHGNLCEHEAAEKAFLEARDLAIKGHPPNALLSLTTHIELGQLAYDTERFEKAVAYFGEAFAVGGARLREMDPATFAAVASDYADALAKTGKSEQSKRLLAEISTIGGASGTGKVGKAAEYVRYPKVCK